MPVFTLEDKLEQLLAAGLGEECPAVRIKSPPSEEDLNPERIFLIRQVPLPMSAQYHPAVTDVGPASLVQWVEAGLGDEYPESMRVYAERAMIRETMNDTRKENKRARNASTRFREFRDKLSLHPVGSLNHRHVVERTEYHKQRTYFGNKLTAAKCLVLLQDMLDTRSVVTSEGIMLLRTAQLLALLDTIPMEDQGTIAGVVRDALHVTYRLRDTPELSTLNSLLEYKKVLSENLDSETVFVLQRIFYIAERLVESLKSTAKSECWE